MRRAAVWALVATLGMAVAAVGGCKQIVKPDPKKEYGPDVRFATVMSPTGERKNLVRSPDGKRLAYRVDTPNSPDGEVEHVYLEAGGQTYMVVGLPYEGKPLENLHWQDAGTLVFERWFEKGSGIRFLMDCYKGVMGRAEYVRR